MSLTQPIRTLEKIDNIPQESTFIISAGDGSGTKSVTQETLQKEVGKALKVGNIEEIQTENKNSLVEAINEVIQSSGNAGNPSVDILDSKEEIEANTESGKAAGAQAVKEMFTELNGNLDTALAGLIKIHSEQLVVKSSCYAAGYKLSAFNAKGKTVLARIAQPNIGGSWSDVVSTRVDGGGVYVETTNQTEYEYTVTLYIFYVDS